MLEIERVFWWKHYVMFPSCSCVQSFSTPAKPLSVVGYRAKWNLISCTAVLVFIT